MTNKIEISRELLDHMINALDDEGWHALANEAAEILAAPAVERQPAAWLDSESGALATVALKSVLGGGFEIPLYTSQPAPVAVVQQYKIGIYGKAYDAPGTKRAYTYEDQPDNLAAHKLGQAAIAASMTRGGDLIDSGLSLLRSLHGEGFGVFEIDACLDNAKEMNK